MEITFWTTVYNNVYPRYVTENSKQIDRQMGL